MHTWPGVSPGIAPRPSFGIPERSRFSIHIGRIEGDRENRPIPQGHYQDWTLHVYGVALRFTEVEAWNAGSFVWFSAEFHDLYAEWTDGTTYQVWIEETPLSQHPQPPVMPPTAPRYLRVLPFNGQLVATWKEPLKDGNAEITGYRLQWKPDAESWSNPNAVEETTVQPWERRTTQVTHIIGGLTNGTAYTVRVIAVNSAGDSAPSEEHFGMPQRTEPRLTGNSVNGAELTLTYDRTLDATSMPDKDRFWVLVNRGLRDIASVSISGRTLTLTLASPVTAADTVEMRYLAPSRAGEPAIRDTDGNYAISCDFSETFSEATNDTDPAGLQPLTAQFEQLPSSHTGPDDELRFRIRFSEPVQVEYGPAFAFLLEVTGGEVTSAWWLDRDTTLWEIVLKPDSHGDITITLPADRACDTRGSALRQRNTAPHDQTRTHRHGRGRAERGQVGNPGPPPGQELPAPRDNTAREGKSEEPQSGIPLAPRNLSATDKEDESVTLTWDAPDDDSITGYQILRRRPSEGEASLLIRVENTGNTDTSYTDADVIPNVLHVYRVSAIGKSGKSRNSNRAEVTPVEPPANSPASGAPEITGAVQVGETLTVDTSSITDAGRVAGRRVQLPVGCY